MEKNLSLRWVLVGTLVGGIAIGAGSTAVIESSGGPSPAEQAVANFEHDYTDPGKCLHNTPYDPARGAFVNVNHDNASGEDVLSDMPLAANAYDPSVLFFDNTGKQQFSPGDHNTAAFLVHQACPGAPDGL